MTLKTRLAKLETIKQPKQNDVCMFITSVYPTGQIKPPVIGYSYNDVKILRLENENDGDLKARVESAALENTIRQPCGVKAVLVFEIMDK